MKRVLKLAGLTLALMVVAALAAMLLAPVDRLRQPIEAAVQQATGRSFHIHGPISLTFTPGVGLDLGAVTLADAPGGAQAAMMTVSKARLSVELLPLLLGEVRPTALTLEGAEIRLMRDDNGNPNWEFAAAGAPRDPLDVLSFGDVRLIDSRILIDPDGEQRELNFVDARLRWPDGAPSLSVAGEIAFRSERFEVEALIEQPHALFGGRSVPLRLAFSSGLAEGELDGDIDLPGDSFEGGVTITAPSARRLAAFFGALIPGDRGFGETSLAAAIRAARGEVHLRDIKFTLDDMTGGGDLGIRLAGPRLSFAGALSIDSFDLAAYLAPAAPDAGAGWSDAPVDLSGLREVDANLALNLRSATLAGMKVSNLHATFALTRGRALLDVTSAALNAGMGRARLAFDAGPESPVWALTLTLTDFDAQSFFADAIASDALTGRGSLSLDLRATGATRRAIVSGLAGSLQLELVNGSLDGVDLAAVARTIGQPGALEGTTADDATNIAALSAAFTIANGMATASALNLTGPSVVLAGRGSSGLAARALRLRFAPQPQGAAALPFSVTGPWAAPTYRPDWPTLKAMLAEGTIGLAALPPERRGWMVVLVKTGAPFPEPPLVAGVAEPG